MSCVLKNRSELVYTIKALAGIYTSRDTARTESVYSEARRREQAQSDAFTIRSLETQVAEYFRTHPLDDDEYPEIAEAMREYREREHREQENAHHIGSRDDEALENLPATPPKI